MKTNSSTLQQPIINISKFEVEEFITRQSLNYTPKNSFPL